MFHHGDKREIKVDDEGRVHSSLSAQVVLIRVTLLFVYPSLIFSSSDMAASGFDAFSEIHDVRDLHVSNITMAMANPGRKRELPLSL